MVATKKESAPGPDGIPYSLHRCAGGLGSLFLINVHQHVLEGGLVPAQLAAGSTVFHSQVLRRRQVWLHREIAGRTTSVDTV